MNRKITASAAATFAVAAMTFITNRQMEKTDQQNAAVIAQGVTDWNVRTNESLIKMSTPPAEGDIACRLVFPFVETSSLEKAQLPIFEPERK